MPNTSMHPNISVSAEDNSKIWWPSPAKINLFLHVCSQFENGYHELQTLFQLLDYCDEIGTQLNLSGEISLANNIEGVKFEDNLIVKAATELLPYRRDDSYGVKLFVRKRIPMGGGLGGGSSNAATVLVALNHLWKCELNTKQLLTIALRLGADVPVFVNGMSAFAEGVGETLISVSIPETFYLVATPKVHISTASVFGHPDLPRNTPKIDFSNYHFEETRNDCEKLVSNTHPEVANLLQWLVHYAPSRMTGTGASVFAQFSSKKDAENVLKQLPNGVSGFVAKGIDSSPLHSVLTQADAKLC